VDTKDVTRASDDETREGRILVALDLYLVYINECVVWRGFAVSDRPMAGVAELRLMRWIDALILTGKTPKYERQNSSTTECDSCMCIIKS
jgi:hypothetical protein